MESPLEQGLQTSLKTKLLSDIIGIINYFVGNKHHIEMSGTTCFLDYIMQNNIIRSNVNTNYSNNSNYSIFTATNSTVTCIQSQTDSYDTTKCDLWPQTWQLIPVSSGVDLEQVLFDFDMSCVECDFSGTNVFVTPRCFLTLITGYNFISSLSLQSAKTKL